MTLENVGDVMHPVIYAYSPFAVFFFVGLVFIGNFLVLNLFIVVIASQLSVTRPPPSRSLNEPGRGSSSCTLIRKI